MTDMKDHWEQVYQNKSPLAVSWFQQKPVLSLELIQHTGIVKSSALIDIGGGASTLVDHLLEEGYRNISVLDISSNALSHAQQRLGPRANSVQWIVADITAFKASLKYQVWHDRAVFHFLTDAVDRSAYVAVLKQSLLPGGHVIIAAFAIGGPLKCSGLDIVQYDANKLCTELGTDFELVEETGELHTTPDGRQQKFGYFRLIYQPSSN
jgi:ubiquinone/menaquinone biosynthesis C-methylase UbiE